MLANLKLQEFRFNWMPTKDLIELTSGFLYTYLIMFTPQMFLESLWSCAPPPIVVSFLQWGVNFIKYVQRNPEVSSIKSFVGIQLHPNWLNACNLRFASNVGLSYNVWSYHMHLAVISHLIAKFWHLVIKDNMFLAKANFCRF